MRESVRESPDLKIVERGLWKGPDIVTAQSVVINHYEQVPVVITEKSIPPDFSFLTHGTSRFVRGFVRKDYDLYPSVRSRYAQVGLNIDNRIVEQIGEWLRNSIHLNEGGRSSNSITPTITVENRGARPVILEEGAHLFRFFNEDYRLYVRDDELVDAVKSGLIRIQGERLGDWTYSYGQVAKSRLPRPTGIFIRINPENRGWIPPDSNNEPVLIPDSGDGYRNVIDSLLKPVPEERTKRILWIGEAIRTTLDPSIDAVLDMIAVKGIKTDQDILDRSTWGTQLNSRVIDGGKTDWPIRVEIVSPTSPNIIPHFVHLRFIKRTRRLTF